MILEPIHVKGVPTFTLINGDGVVVEKFTVSNIITSAGRNYIASRMFDSSSPVMGWIALGSGSTPTLFSDVSLNLETARVAMSGSTIVQNVINYRATFGPGIATGIVREAGTFNASNTNTYMISRVAFPAFTKAAADTVIVEWGYEIL